MKKYNALVNECLRLENELSLKKSLSNLYESKLNEMTKLAYKINSDWASYCRTKNIVWGLISFLFFLFGLLAGVNII